MKCPYCGKEAKIADAVKMNLETYGGSARARTGCCGALIRVYPVVTYHCTETEQKGHDDWGN